ncbi:hypothetical protein GCM10007977_072930 [Dactylosporangium sucinum]|uniref:DUF7779 domain-containing protein n=1 Tax=Dactylosporangium sucinum TaxID=1424081 RepID=A0A917U632_9ACTN|nr:hypothetical protein GCM10007977_072930 [Dactylosporangium sucinum]
MGTAVTADRGGVAVGTLVYQRRVAAGEPLRLDPRPGQVLGRDELLAGIAGRLAGGVVALCGLGGVGKTTAALEYAYRHLDAYALVWMFHAEEATALLAQFHDLAELLDPAGLLDRADPVARVHGALAHRPGRWLLVFDNVRDRAAVRRWLPPKGNGHTLITTQDGHWPASQAIHVDGLRRQAAVQFLLNQAGEYDTASAEAIADELGGLPLALAQAGGFVASTGRSLAEYLNLLQHERAELLGRGAPTEHRTSVVATWRLAFEDLAETNPGAIALLRLLSCLAPEDIPFRLLLDATAQLPPDLAPAVASDLQQLRATTFALDDAVAGLRRHSLIGPPGAVVSVHRLVQAVTLDQLTPDERQAWQTAAADLVEAAVPIDVNVRDAWPVCAQLLPHALAVLDPIGMAMWRLARSLGNAGDYATAHTVWQTLADAHETNLGPDHPDTLTTRANLARWTGYAGDAARARDLYAELLPVRERVSGPDHPDMLTDRANLAYWTGEAGDPARARDLFAELLPVRERVSGPDHQNTLNARANLARWTGNAGDAARARDLFAELLPVLERVSGADHPETLTDRANLAYYTGRAGDAERARDLFAELLPVREQVSGPDHPSTLITRANLAHWTGEAGDPARARELFAELLPVRERVSGPEHPATVTDRANLAHWTRIADQA